MSSSEDFEVYQYKSRITGKTWVGNWHPLDPTKKARDLRSPKDAAFRRVVRWRLKVKPCPLTTTK